VASSLTFSRRCTGTLVGGCKSELDSAAAWLTPSDGSEIAVCHFELVKMLADGTMHLCRQGRDLHVSAPIHFDATFNVPLGRFASKHQSADFRVIGPAPRLRLTPASLQPQVARLEVLKVEDTTHWPLFPPLKLGKWILDLGI
jgi:hypothetical protein